MPNARLTVIDDFRSGDFKNLAGYQRRFRRAKPGHPRLAATIRRRKIRRDLPSRLDHRHDPARSIRPDARQRGEFSPPPEFREAEQDAGRFMLRRRRPTARRALPVRNQTAPRRRTFTPSRKRSWTISQPRVASDVDGLDHRRPALFQRLRSARSAQRRAREHGLPFVAPDESRAASADFQARRAETRFRLREGHRRRKHSRARGEGERNLQSRFRPGALIQRTGRCPEPLVRHQLQAGLHRESARPLPEFYPGRFDQGAREPGLRTEVSPSKRAWPIT